MFELVHVLVMLLCCATYPTESVVVHTDDPNWYFTEYNWADDDVNGGKMSANPGVRTWMHLIYTVTVCKTA